MKKILTAILAFLCAGVVFGQTASTSTSNASGTGNSQNITFTSPPTSTATVNTTANVNNTQSGTMTQNYTGGTASTLTTDGTTTSNVVYSGTQTVKNVPTVIGPNLTSSNDTCMGSTSGGIAGPGFGVTVGSTWTDDQCKRLKMSRELWNKGMKAASLAMDCMDPQARDALEITGTKCPQSMTEDERVKAYGPQASAKGAVPEPVAVQQVQTPVSQTVTPVSVPDTTVNSTSEASNDNTYAGHDPLVCARLRMSSC